ncbi:MAG: hypothetical protein U0736_12920 [Gemmataceae bacterium]
MVLDGLNDSEDEGPSGAIKTGVSYDKERWERASKRKGTEPIKLGRTSDKTKAIEPPAEHADQHQLRQHPAAAGARRAARRPRHQHRAGPAGAGRGRGQSGKPDLDQAGPVSLKSALNLILHQVRLTYVIKDEVLQITTEEHARGKLVAVTYPVADLVILVENFGDIRGNNGPTAGRRRAGASGPSFAPLRWSASTGC